MQVLETGPFHARCRGRNGECWLDTRLIDPPRKGDWLLAFADTARELLTEADAEKINAALEALDCVLANSVPADASALDKFFPDLAGREPQLPDFLRARESEE
jgi:hydrogenase expression/formation protein HypC